MNNNYSLKNELVSIIIPSYNRKNFIIPCLQSVYDQTYKNFEVIFVDDGSTDDTKKLISQLPFRIKYFYIDNAGVAKARNFGLTKSKGSYICFLDSDDLWVKTKLEKQINFFQKNSCAKICYTDEKWIRHGKVFQKRKSHKKYGGYIFEKILPLCIISASSVMIKRSLFDEVGMFDESLLVCEDYDFWLRIGCKYPIYLLEEELMIKQDGHIGQLSKAYWGMDRFRIKSLVKLLRSNLLSITDKKVVVKILKKKCTIYINGCKKRNKNNDLRDFLFS